MRVEKKYFDMEGNEIDHFPVFSDEGFQPQKGEIVKLGQEKWLVIRSEVDDSDPDTRVIKIYCEQQPSP
jgi:hypothetical protein